MGAPAPLADHRPDVRSEVGPLRAVLVHRPGVELARLTPTNKDQLLFDELVWVERAQQEHDAFTAVLRRAGVEVLYLTELLAEVLADPELRTATIAAHATEFSCGPTLAGRVRAYLEELPPPVLAERLVGGVTVAEVAAGGRGLVGTVLAATDLLLPPLPNTVFVRDTSAWIGDGVVLAPMNRLARRRETALLRLVYRHHPRFRDCRVWFGDEPAEQYPATFEGGDLMVLAPDGLALGLSERTTPQGAEVLVRRLFDAGLIARVLVVDLPKVRATMHLDTVVAMVDRDAFLLYPQLRAAVRCYALTRAADGGLHVEAVEELATGLAWAAGLDHVRTIEPPLDSVEAAREQWNDANNTLALRPGEVVAYERNTATNAVLERAGIVVHTVPSSELSRGRGGPRCMSCPIRRGHDGPSGDAADRPDRH